MFSPATQQLFQIDEPAALSLLGAMRDGATFPALADILEDHALDGEIVLAEWLVEWSRAGIVCAHLRSDGPVRHYIAVGPHRFEIAGTPGATYSACLAPYRLAEGSSGPAPTERLVIGEHGPVTAIGVAGKPARITHSRNAVCDLRNRILGLILEQAHGPALHCAAIDSPKGLILLVGSPGSGKSTLSLALMRQGWDICSDDVTLIDARGHASGLPLPLTIKEGAWPIAERLVPECTEFPALERADGAVLKYLPLPKPTAPAVPRRVQAVVKLARTMSANGGAPSLSEWDKIAATTELFAEGHHPAGVADASMVEAMIAMVEGADCRILNYAEAEDAASLLAKTYG